MSYLDFLTKLIALGDKLPAAFAIVQRIIASVKELMGLFAVAPADDVDEEAAELKVAQALAGDGAFFDLATLRAVWKFANDNPWILELLTKIFAKG